MSDLRTAAQQALEALKQWNKSGYTLRNQRAAAALRAALAEHKPCQYPDCVDNGPEGKCTRWLLAECSMSEDYKPQRPAEPVRAAAAKSAHDKMYSEVELADAYRKGWNDAMLRRNLGPYGIKEET